VLLVCAAQSGLIPKTNRPLFDGRAGTAEQRAEQSRKKKAIEIAVGGERERAHQGPGSVGCGDLRAFLFFIVTSLDLGRGGRTCAESKDGPGGLVLPRLGEVSEAEAGEVMLSRLGGHERGRRFASWLFLALGFLALAALLIYSSCTTNWTRRTVNCSQWKDKVANHSRKV
jgi:hypothetical protein